MPQNVKKEKLHSKTSIQINQQPKRHSPSSKKNTNISKEKQTNPSLLDKCVVAAKGKGLTASKKSSSDNHSGSPTEEKMYTQDVLGIRQVYGGMVLMNDGRVVGIQEVIPMNYYQKETSEKNSIYESYKGLFRIAPKFLHFKMRTEKADVEKLINNILKSNAEEESKDVLLEMSDYIDHIKTLQQNDSICKRFYIMWNYEGDSNGKRSTDINQIYQAMEETRLAIRQVFAEIGQYTFTPTDASWYVCELLYKFFNPKTSVTEPFSQRFLRIRQDEAMFNEGLASPHVIDAFDEDFIAPKGITRRGDYIIMDGIYHTFITLKDSGHPSKVLNGWTNGLCDGYGYDLDIISERLPYDATLNSIEQFNRFTRVSANKNRFNPDKHEELSRSIANKKYVTNCMRTMDEDLWNCIIIITIRANSFQNMNRRKNLLIKRLKSQGLYTEDSFLTVWKNFQMVMPFTNVNRALFNKNKRNYLTSSMASLYNYTAFELFDDDGVVLGRNSNGAMVSQNNFNTQRYTNANILLLGSSGSGKTYTELLMSRRMRLTGRRTFFILPVKGYEYYDSIRALNGSIIKMFPGGDDCINIMQIRPEVKINKDLLKEGEKIDTSPLLSKKITTITTWIQLLMKQEKLTITEISTLNGIVTDVYKRFGITNDNDSIYRSKKHKLLKEMPILQDLYDAILRNEDLAKVAVVLIPFIEGTCQNFNGQTNINLNNKCIAFDIDEDVVGEDLISAFMFVAYDFLYDLVKQDMLSRDVIILDEAWKMMDNDDCAKQVYKMSKLIRGYGGSLIIASQDIEEFINQSCGYGNAIVSNTEIKILMKMKKSALNALSNAIDLNTKDKESIKKYQRGTGIIITDNDKIPITFLSSDREEELFTTDINVKERIAKKKQAEALAQQKTRKKSTRTDVAKKSVSSKAKTIKRPTKRIPQPKV